MAKDAVEMLEAIRQKLIKDLLEKKQRIDEQLKGLGYEEKSPR